MQTAKLFRWDSISSGRDRPQWSDYNQIKYANMILSEIFI